MTKLIKDWKELSELKNDKYHIAFDSECYCGWLIPITDEPVGNRGNFICNCPNDDKYWDNHAYLSTHTFYGSNYKQSTKILQEHGFDVEIDNWDKETK